MMNIQHANLLVLVHILKPYTCLMLVLSWDMFNLYSLGTRKHPLILGPILFAVNVWALKCVEEGKRPYRGSAGQRIQS